MSGGFDRVTIDDGWIGQVELGSGRRFVQDGAIGCLSAPAFACELKIPRRAVRVRNGEIKMVARIIGQGRRPAVVSLKANFEMGLRSKLEDDVEVEGKWIALLSRGVVAEAHSRQRVGVIDDAKFGVPRETVLRHGAHRSLGVAPAINHPVHKMARDEREENRVAPAHLEDARPVGVVRPVNDFPACLFPAEKPRPMIGRDQGAAFAVGQFKHRLVLEKDRVFHARMLVDMPVEAMPDESKVDAATIQAAYAECTRLAREHYENFPVGKLVPREMQKHVHAVYAFARYADDLADEGYAGAREDNRDVMTPDERLAALEDWEHQLLSKPSTPGLHPIFLALHETIRELDLPTSLFTDLLSAFKQDVIKRRYANFVEVLDYCRRSANPIGRLVLLLHGVREERLHELSDNICTALQLANFWQDVGVDLKKDRIYLPENERENHEVSEQSLFAYEITPAYRSLLKFQVERTQAIFDQGRPLTRELRGKLRIEIRMTWLGGTAILRKIEAQDYDTLNRRPKLGKVDMAMLLAKALIS